MQLLPRDEKFFDLLLNQARTVLEAAALLTGSPGDALGIAKRARDLERKGSQQRREIVHRLHKTFITPIDPEDIQLLASHIHDILDHLEAVTYRFNAYGLHQKPERIPEIARMVQGCVEAVITAIEGLGGEGIKKSDQLTASCEEVYRREIETEDRVREVVRDLFNGSPDPLLLIKQKEVYELLETAADCCQNVANVIEGIAVKNS